MILLELAAILALDGNVDIHLLVRVRLTVNQPQYNMFHRQKVDVDFLPLFEERGMGTTIW